MNYLIVSPEFPRTQQYFAENLRNKGVNVLGIGTQPYDQLSDTLRTSLTEYYRVDHLENFDEVSRGVAFLIYKHGPIDRVESNNEHWLSLDAALREQFNISGVRPAALEKTKYKSRMKAIFKKAGLSVVPGYLVQSRKALHSAIKKVGLPIVAKPDNGVGSASTYKIATQEDVTQFLTEWNQEVPYFVEPYVSGAELVTYDGYVDSQGAIKFEGSFSYTAPTLELLHEQRDYGNLFVKNIDEKLATLGKKVVEAFGMRERFFHIEFFKTAAGEYLPLEYNNRLPGAFTIDIYNHVTSNDLYALYACDVVGEPISNVTPQHIGLSLSRRDAHQYTHSHDVLLDQLAPFLKESGRYPDVFSGVMGNTYYFAICDTMEDAHHIMTSVFS